MATRQRGNAAGSTHPIKASVTTDIQVSLFSFFSIFVTSFPRNISLYCFISDDEAKESTFREITTSLTKHFDLETSCGYITLLNIAARRKSNLRRIPNITVLSADTFESECDEDGITMKAEEDETDETACETVIGTIVGTNGSVDGGDELTFGDALPGVIKIADDVLDDKNNELNVFNKSDECQHKLDSPSRSSMQEKVKRSFSSEHLIADENWLPLQVSYGLPLFDSVLNSEICEKVTNFLHMVYQNLVLFIKFY